LQLCLRDKVLAKDYLAAGEIGSKFAAMDEIEAAHLLLDSLDVSDYQVGNSSRLIVSRLIVSCLIVSQRVVRYQVGNTKVFFKREAMEAMEASRARVVDSFLTRLQATVRRMIYFKQYVRLKNSAVTVQKLARGKAARQHVREEKGARTVQAQWRGFSAQKEFQESKSAAVKIQNSYRRMDAIKQAQNRRIDANAALIQALIRCDCLLSHAHHDTSRHVTDRTCTRAPACPPACAPVPMLHCM
jgi:myosin heavy subunit